MAVLSAASLLLLVSVVACIDEVIEREAGEVVGAGLGLFDAGLLLPQTNLLNLNILITISKQVICLFR